MKIIILHESGSRETIELIAPLDIHEGTHLNRINSADGLEHYFTPEGYYDGWGGMLHEPTAPDDAFERVKEIEAMRLIDKPPEAVE